MAWIPGDWWVACHVCGMRYYASKMVKRWDGAIVCPADNDPRHPQDLIKAIPDQTATPWSMPEPSEISAIDDSSYPDLVYSPGNLLSNPGFEVYGGTSAQNGWFFNSDTFENTDTEYIRTGNKSVKLREGVGGPNLISENIRARDGETYVFGVWLKMNASDMPAANPLIRLRAYDSAGTQIEVYGTSATANKSLTGWQHLTASRTMRATGASANLYYIRLDIEAGASTGSFYVDSAYVARPHNFIPVATFGEYL